MALSEIFADGRADGGGAMGFLLSRLGPAKGPVLWIQDRMARLETGKPYQPALARSLLRLELAQAQDVLSAAEEGLRCRALAAVVAEIWGDPAALSFTVTKRLALRAEASGVACWLLRHGACVNLSAARDRWRVSARPSAPNLDDARAPGAARWQVELFRSRDKRPGQWMAGHEGFDPEPADFVDQPAAIPDGTLAADAGGALRGLAG